MAFTEQDAIVKQLQQDQPGWSTQKTVDWANRYYQNTPQAAQTQTAQGATTPAAPSNTSAPPTPDPFTAMGGGVFVNGGWVPKDHPAARQAQPAAPIPPPGMPGAGQKAPADRGVLGGSTNPVVPKATERADALFDTLLNRSQQSTNINRNDPVIKQQTDTYRANQDRALRDYKSELAERSGPLTTGARLSSERLAAERMGSDAGRFESELMGRELQNRRGEIQHALDSMQGMLTADQERALKAELTQIDDSTKRYGIDIGAQSEREGRDLQRYGIDTGAKEAQLGRDLQRYGIDTSAKSSKEIAMLDAMLKRYGIDVGAQGERDRLGVDVGRAEADAWFRGQGL